jgi:hypothetical protein
VTAKVPPTPATAPPASVELKPIKEDDSDRKSATGEFRTGLWKCTRASAAPLKVDYVVGKSLMEQLELDKPSIRALYQAEKTGIQ